MKTVQQGAATSVWCATSPRLDGLGGVYCENSDISPLAQDGNAQPQAPGTVSYGVLPYSLDLESANRLWDLSARFTTG